MKVSVREGEVQKSEEGAKKRCLQFYCSNLLIKVPCVAQKGKDESAYTLCISSLTLL